MRHSCTYRQQWFSSTPQQRTKVCHHKSIDLIIHHHMQVEHQVLICHNKKSSTICMCVQPFVCLFVCLLFVCLIVCLLRSFSHLSSLSFQSSNSLLLPLGS